MNSDYKRYIERKAEICRSADSFSPDLYEKYDVKKGLRDSKGNGVVVGLTTVSEVNGTNKVDGVKVPCEGRLKYRGYDIRDLAKGFLNKRFGFEECTYLLLFGELPDKHELEQFSFYLAEQRKLPVMFVRDVVMVAAGKDIMNSITRCILSLASYDKKALDNSLDNVIRQCIFLISVFPMLTVYSYHAYNHYINDESMYIHRPDPKLSTAENILRMLRPDKSYTYLEATVLDLALVLHMEHGGGNNSTFTTRVTTSSGSDTYAVIADAALAVPEHLYREIHMLLPPLCEVPAVVAAHAVVHSHGVHPPLDHHELVLQVLHEHLGFRVESQILHLYYDVEPAPVDPVLAVHELELAHRGERDPVVLQLPLEAPVVRVVEHVHRFLLRIRGQAVYQLVLQHRTCYHAENSLGHGCHIA